MDKYILFDFDGTLLFMDQDEFVQNYYKALYKKFHSIGLDPKKCSDAIVKAVYLVITNDDNISNEEKFWNVFESETSISQNELRPMLDEFYSHDFCKLKECTQVNPYAKEVIKCLKNKGYKIILATNPVFPKQATYERIRWAGLDASDFEYITTYENSCYCKPNLHYYQELIDKFNLDAKNTWMIGNDMYEDGISTKLGMKVIITTDNLIDKKEKYDVDYILSWEELSNKIKEL